MVSAHQVAAAHALLAAHIDLSILKWDDEQAASIKSLSRAPKDPAEEWNTRNHPMAEQSAVAMLPVPCSDASHAVSVGEPNMTLISNSMQCAQNQGRADDCYSKELTQSSRVLSSTCSLLISRTD